MNNVSFKSTRIPFNSKRLFLDYLDVLPPKDFKSFYNKKVEDCLYTLRRTDNNIGILLGKDRCFYIFGNDIGQDRFLYKKLKKFDPNVTYVKDVSPI